MRFSLRLLAAACVPFVCLDLLAADPAPDLKPLMTKPGKLLFRDDFNAGLGKAWRASKGKWENAAGAVRAKELQEDHHGAVARTDLKFRDAIFQFSFQLQGARQTTLSINDVKRHICRALITKDILTVQKDDFDHDGPDKAAVFERRPVKLPEGQWHTVLIELKGGEMLAKIGEVVVFGRHEAIDIDKANFGLTVAGESVQFKNLRVWEALPNPGWAKTRAELEKRPKAVLPQPAAGKGKGKGKGKAKTKP